MRATEREGEHFIQNLQPSAEILCGLFPFSVRKGFGEPLKQQNVSAWLPLSQAARQDYYFYPLLFAESSYLSATSLFKYLLLTGKGEINVLSSERNDEREVPVLI